ncbi:Thioredoxin [Alloactinosynnema sp. L-07]|uniref:thioredoxin family protein n=1 Tax=Alloactinosynnema sp. L-07 TaxID=1653480 RepID=UPI00065EFDA6|nr:thioredoxin family protein [Alloactinosynnema sp. L-07]CRK58357.1 Thioredoxin [Alloactinosynnema sp. L-07]
MSTWKRLLCGAIGVLALVTGPAVGAAQAAPTAPAAENVIDVTAANHAEVLNISKTKLVILDFGATWCPPCQKMKPVLAKLAKEYNGRILVGMVDADRSRDLMRQYSVRYLPTLVPLRNGKELPSSRLVGFPGERQLKAWIDKQLAKG